MKNSMALPVAGAAMLLFLGAFGTCAVAQAPATSRPQRVGPIYSPEGPASGRRTDNSTPIELKPGPQLFLDDYLIDSSRNIRRRPMTLARDASIPNPIVTGARGGAGDQNFQPWLTVMRDPQTQRFRIW